MLTIIGLGAAAILAIAMFFLVMSSWNGPRKDQSGTVFAKGGMKPREDRSRAVGRGDD